MREDCVEWKGAKNRKGYGVFKYEGKIRPAHRAEYCKKKGVNIDSIKGPCYKAYMR